MSPGFKTPRGSNRARNPALIAAIAGEAEARVPPFDAVAFPLGALWTG